MAEISENLCAALLAHFYIHLIKKTHEAKIPDVYSTLCTTTNIFQTDERIEVKQGLGFVDYQTNMVKLAKNIAKTAQDMVCTLLLNTFNAGHRYIFVTAR